MSGTTAAERGQGTDTGAAPLTRSQVFQLMQKLRQVTQPVVPPAAVAVRLGTDSDERDGLLYGWAADPRGDGGLRGLVRIPAQRSAATSEEQLGWVTPDQLRPR